LSSQFDINDFHDTKVWDYICSGRTKGIFQLESNLGRHWSKQLHPRSISELSALISLIRPGCLRAYVDGKSMTQHYCDRKAGKDKVIYQHESLEDILSETYGVLVYQEQSMMIAQKLAGFDLKEADALRKAIGKKKADLMEKVKGQFLEGAEKLGIVSKEIAQEIFGWIEKSNRYAFNKSHAVSYAINAYWSAYCKLYRPSKFYVTYLNHAYRKPDSQREMKELIVDAKGNDIEVYPPRLNYLYKDFTDHEGKIIFGISHVKNVGDAECAKIENLKSSHEISQFKWLNCLMEMIYNGKVNKRAAISLISVGAFNGPKNHTDRKKMLYEFDSWQQLTAREQKYVYENYKKFNTLYDCVNDMLMNFKLTSKRQQTVADINQALANPMYGIKDSVATIAQDEENLMGCALTCSKVDDTEEASYATMCRDIANGAITGKVNIVVSISSVRQYKTKKGKNPGQLMAFVCAEDSSGMLDSITVFPEAFEEYKDLLVEGNTVLIHGEISKRDKTSIIVNRVKQV
jgi:DNA polymerase-3 subunit alpha